MFRLDAGLRVYLHRDAVDFRKNINGLALPVEQALGLDPFASAVFVFRNQRADRIKILGWDRNGFWLLLKRLEADRFAWPREATVAMLTVEPLHWLLQGIDIEAMRRHPHREYHRAA
ncbi:transposase, IS66 family (plasmid) [Cupriavidus taiwanensis LMG 19424]|uniref:Transposase, IS66 family n=1 Tax=Cupriavidus taiwanensis (strain DSM 17343 / BCRC 17206 / CCUG 44338 / CIP 107171 / LMG 19424 / R1) TaxID=977880 RepID=B2AIZ8_CUPTR|nr:IS66 family insertion sequence element accessory protein TnpB [Cupriavidus taiwanensis]CAP64048.1 transposase, IS66 family [Cupriavidus taiwanensis LMG 19424]